MCLLTSYYQILISIQPHRCTNSRDAKMMLSYRIAFSAGRLGAFHAHQIKSVTMEMGVQCKTNRPPLLEHRRLHLAPPFLLDEPYIPRFQMLSGSDIAHKRASAHGHLTACNLCPRKCNVNRYEKVGVCLIGEKTKVNVIAPHFGEGEAHLLGPSLEQTIWLTANIFFF